MTPSNSGKPRYRWLLLLLLPCIGLLWVPVYNHVGPTLRGIPFFFWYQFAWVFISAAITAVVYVKSEPRITKPPSAEAIQSHRQHG